MWRERLVNIQCRGELEVVSEGVNIGVVGHGGVESDFVVLVVIVLQIDRTVDELVVDELVVVTVVGVVHVAACTGSVAPTSPVPATPSAHIALPTVLSGCAETVIYALRPLDSYLT